MSKQIKVRGVYEKVPGSGIWWVRYADASGRIRREVAGRKSAAITLYRKRKTEILQRKKLPENLRSVVKVSGLVPALTRDYAVNSRKSGESVERRLRKHILPFFATMAADELGTHEIEGYVDARRNEGAANATIDREFATLKRMYNLAKTAAPPIVHSVPTFPHLKENPPRKGFVEAKDYEKLQHSEELWLKVILASGYTFGLRRGELLRLEVRQIDPLRRMVYLGAGSTKNGDARRIKLTDDVYELLARCVRNEKPEDHVFTRVDGKPVLDFRGTWYALCVRAGLGKFVKSRDKKVKWHGLIFHDLRRSAVRNMVRAGISEKVAMSLSGQETRSVFDRYDITSDADITQAAEMIERARRDSRDASSRRQTVSTDTITGTNDDESIPTDVVKDVNDYAAIA